MEINWTVRFRNPMFWIQIVAVTVLTLINGVGMQWADMTSWDVLGSTILQAIANPVTVVATLVAWWTTATDPTTPGIWDSERAMDYVEPGVMEGEEVA